MDKMENTGNISVSDRITETNVSVQKINFPKGLYVLISLVLVISLASVVLSAKSFGEITKVTAEKSEETKEDDVKIAENYTIRSTTHISDAYKSGDNSKLNDKDRETLDMASAVLDDIIKDGMSDFEKEKAVFEWMQSNLGQDRGLLTVIPSTGEDADNPYGVLKYKNAVCVGYATTFRLFMQMLDIPCMVVHESGKYHSWDLVSIEDEWYHVDVYSAVNNKNYRYFNMPDKMVTQNWDHEFFPAATSMKYNVSYMEAVKKNDVFELPAMIRKAIENKDTMISVLFPKTLQEVSAQKVTQMISQIQEKIWAAPDYSNGYLDTMWYPMDDGYLFMISLNGFESVFDEDISDEDKEKIEQTVNEAFEGFGGEDDEEIMYDEDGNPIENEEEFEEESVEADDSGNISGNNSGNNSGAANSINNNTKPETTGPESIQDNAVKVELSENAGNTGISITNPEIDKVIVNGN